MCLKDCFNLFRFEKAQAARDEQLFWSIQLNSDWLNCYVAKGFRIGYVNTRPINHKFISRAMSMLRKQSVLWIKDKQTIISRLEKGEKGTN